MFDTPQMLSSIADGTLPAHLTIKRLTTPDAIAAPLRSAAALQTR